MKYFIQTFGCQMNYSDSERIASLLHDLGYQKATSKKEADILVFNTCSVKQRAEDRVYGLRRQLADLQKENEKLRIAVTGCMVHQTSTRNTEHDRDKVLSIMPEMDIAFRIEDTAKLPTLIKEVSPEADFATTFREDEGSIANYFKILPKKEQNFSVFVPVMTGCDKFCTYCIVPYSRGRERSRAFEEILQECERHVADGAVEITLVGQTVNSYGLSFNDKKSGEFEPYGASPFATLLKEVDKLHAKGLRRLRFTSPHPRDFSDELIQTLGSLKTACPYIHMPIQSGDDEVLRRMNRNYTVAEYKEIMNKLRAAIPGCAISTDIIVGFCGETDEQFTRTMNVYEEMEWDMCFLSRYSPRKGTYSERNLPDNVSAKTKAERWHRLNDLLNKIATKKHAAFLGKTVEVLVEKCKAQKDGTHSCSGRTPQFKEVFFRSDKDLTGQLAQVKITKTDRFYLEGVSTALALLSNSV